MMWEIYTKTSEDWPDAEAKAALKELLAAVQDEEVWQDRYSRAVAIGSLTITRSLTIARMATIKVASEGLDKARERKRAALAKCHALGLPEE